MSTADLETGEAAGEEKKKLELDVKVDAPSTCERHVVVTIPQAEVARYRQEAFNEILPKASIPGFRAGKAPRKLVESQFKEQVTEQVKSSLVMDSLQQVTDGGHFSAISEPDFDYGAVALPDNGDFRYEFKIEVRPDFETPKWEGLKLERPVCELTETHIDNHLARTLTRFIGGEPVDGAAQLNDSVTLNATFTLDGKTISEFEEETVVLRQELRFSDGVIENFGKMVVGKKEGDEVEVKITISESASNEALRGKEVQGRFTIHEIRRIQVNEISPNDLESLGFDTTAELREFVKAELARQFEYHQQQSLRKQIVDELTKDANWDMPESLIRRQTNRELQRMVLELQRSGFNEEQISRYINTVRLNARESTIRSLREHFLLEKIAEETQMEPAPDDYEKEIALIAEQTDASPRRVRAQLEKSGQMDAIRNQIIERQVIAKIAAAGKVSDKKDDSFIKQDPNSSDLGFWIAGEVEAIPDANYNNEPEAVPGTAKISTNKN